MQQQPDRLGRRWLWGTAFSLRNGGTALALCLALQTGLLGITALAALPGGYILKEVLEATSRGD